MHQVKCIKSKNSGFTLIELLVVIAIIAILAAILFPVFAKVREKARQTSCLSNEKQLGLSIVQYVEDYDEQFPNGFSGATNSPGAGWATQVYPYVKSVGVYKCPDDGGDGGGIVSYAINMDLAGGGLGTGTLTAAPLAQLNAPASTVALIEVNQCDNTTAVPGTEVPGPTGNASTPSVNGLAYAGGNSVVNIAGHCTNLDTGGFNGVTGGYYGIARHTNGVNYLLADGHAKWFQPGSVSAGFDAGTSTSTQTTTGSSPVVGNAAGTGALNSPLAATFSAI